ncbi:MAG: metallophosphoesterase [Trueperaceae bacterium]|nr:metallophosphoesterase [Trueperaceae bacterium]
MKVLHTADWHAGRGLHGVDRTGEIKEALEELAELVKVERVDLVVVAGDLYDNRNPSAAARTPSPPLLPRRGPCRLRRA